MGRSAIGPHQCRTQSQHRGFTGSVRSPQANDITATNDEVDTGEGGKCAHYNDDAIEDHSGVRSARAVGVGLTVTRHGQCHANGVGSVTPCLRQMLSDLVIPAGR